jgi:hypothetical protein
MTNTDTEQPLGKSLGSLSGNFLQLLKIDILTNLRRFLSTIVCSLLALLFGICVWIILNISLAYYLQLQEVTLGIIFSILLALNIIALLICIFLSRWQVKKLQFYYTDCAIQKLTDTTRTIL